MHIYMYLVFSALLLVFQLLALLFFSVLVSSRVRCTHIAYCLPSLFGTPYFLSARGTPGLSHSRVLCELKDEERLDLIYLFLREQCAPPFSLTFFTVVWYRWDSCPSQRSVPQRDESTLITA